VTAFDQQRSVHHTHEHQHQNHEKDLEKQDRRGMTGVGVGESPGGRQRQDRQHKQPDAMLAPFARRLIICGGRLLHASLPVSDGYSDEVR
jgi:hypothetical protein